MFLTKLNSCLTFGVARNDVFFRIYLKQLYRRLQYDVYILGTRFLSTCSKQTMVPRQLNTVVLGKSGTLETTAGKFFPRVLSLPSLRKKEEKGRERTLGTTLVCRVLI